MLLDDNSTDGTVNYIENIYKLDSKVKVCKLISSVNVGINSQINKLVRATSGKYIFMYSCDDRMPKNGLSVLVQSLMAEAGTNKTIYTFPKEFSETKDLEYKKINYDKKVKIGYGKFKVEIDTFHAAGAIYTAIVIYVLR